MSTQALIYLAIAVYTVVVTAILFMAVDLRRHYKGISALLDQTKK